jgi:aminoglycoside phosphotransferase
MAEQYTMFSVVTHLTYQNIMRLKMGKQYPIIDLVICHGDFLNADHNYIHENKSVKGFGSYGDIMIRDRKMYVAPTRASNLITLVGIT